MQIIVSSKGFMKIYPMKLVSNFPSVLREFAKDVVAPEILVTDPHKCQKSKEVQEFAIK